MKIVVLGASNSSFIKIAVDNYIRYINNKTFKNQLDIVEYGGGVNALFFQQKGTPSLQNTCEVIIHKKELESCRLIITESNINDLHRNKV